MRRLFLGALLTACLVAPLATTSPALAGQDSVRLAKSSCAQMGLSVGSLRPLFGTVSVKWAGYECGVVGNGVDVTLYLFPISEKAAEMKQINLHHAKRLGGLGPGAEFSNFGGGDFNLVLSSKTRFVFIEGQLVPSQGKLISLAHVIYRALA